MGETVFGPEARLELIEGEIIEMAPIDSPHAGCVKALSQLLFQRASGLAIVSVQDPAIISDRSVPQPDVALLKPRRDFYRGSHPTVADILLAVEVADSTLAFDLRRKAPLYGRCGLAETWVIDVNREAVHVFREPNADGYRVSCTVQGRDRLECLLLPQVSLSVAELFPTA